MSFLEPIPTPFVAPLPPPDPPRTSFELDLDTDIDIQIAQDLSQFYADPYGFVMWAFQWGEGDLFGFDGPDAWQRDVLDEIGAEVIKRGFDGVNPVDPIREAVASGHGIGKSALTAWLILWIMATRRHAKGVVTANTSDQLKTKTWGELGKWLNRSVLNRWFEYSNTRGGMVLYHTSWKESWRCDGQTCREENSESFAGLHSASSTPFYIFDEACHDDQTEVLSDRGWLLFKDVTENDQLMTMNIESGDAYYDKPSHLHASHRKGEMLIREGRGSNFCVTPNHRMMYTSRKLPHQRRFDEAGDMVWSNKRFERVINWHHKDVDTFTIPGHDSKRKYYPEIIVNMDDWCEFLAWFITEGSVQRQNGAAGTVSISQHTKSNSDNVAAIVRCVERMGFKACTTFQSVYFYAPQVATYLDTLGKGFNNKRVPQTIKDLSVRQLNIFLDAAVKGDGYHKTLTSDVLYTSSPHLADDYQEMVLKTGCNSTLTKRSIEGQRKWVVDHWATSSCDGFVVSRAFNSAKVDVDKAKPESIAYDGMVYCATASGGTLLTRRKGVVLWSGNSAVPDKIWEVAEGGLTDGEPMIFAFGNPTRTSGKFKECFGLQKHRWNTRQIDSRTAKMTNKKLFQEWIDDWGEDSDFVRVRVLGKFPRASVMQLIPSDVVEDAMVRQAQYIGDDPLICGVDVARGGGDECVIQFRRGFDARSEKVYKIPAEKSRDSMKVISLLNMVFDKHKPDLIFVDETGLGGPIVDRLRQQNWPVFGVNFGGSADDKRYYQSKASEMWARMKNWLIAGGAIKNNPELETQLTEREYGHNSKDQLVIETKDHLKGRGLSSPDWADGLALTFAFSAPQLPKPRGRRDDVAGARGSDRGDYNPVK